MKTIRGQMLISGDSNGVRCKVFARTLAGTALDWFSRLLGGSIKCFEDFVKQFSTQFSANRPKAVTEGFNRLKGIVIARYLPVNSNNGQNRCLCRLDSLPKQSLSK